MLGAHGLGGGWRTMRGRLCTEVILLQSAALVILSVITAQMPSPAVLDYAHSQILNPGEEPVIDPLDYESDIRTVDILAEERDRKKRNALKDGRVLWRNRTVPYVLNSQLSQRARQAVLDAIEDYDAYTCIRFIPRDPKKHPDFVEFIKDKGCYSYVGRNSGRQTLSLGEGCEVKGIAIHEMMHVVGFMHEQSRSDRDSFVTVLYQNIPRKLWDQFDKMKSRQENNLGAKYDYNSVMHYSRKAFTANGRDTILPKLDGVAIGQRRGFSTVDVEKINVLYGCTELTVTGIPGPIIEPSKPSDAQEHNTTPPVPQLVTDHIRKTTPSSAVVASVTSTTDPNDQIDHTGSPEIAERTDAPSVSVGGGCVNRRNQLYCDLKKTTGWCRKSTTIAFEHCPLTCGACGRRQGGPAVKPSHPLSPNGALPGEIFPTDTNFNETEIVDNGDCRGDACCDVWKSCFEFHCVLYSRYCAKTCGMCT